MNIMQEIRGTRLIHLFDARLQYQSDMEAVVPGENREGVLIGVGHGVVTGDEMRGKIRWVLYSGNCDYVYVQAGIEPPPGQHLCTVNPGGVIKTDDGAEIWFDAKGYGLRGADETDPHMWTLTMAVQFKTADERYVWLNNTLGTIISRFDEKSGSALWQIHMPQTS
ncbi:MAG: DUF3237 family protein [Chloroflexi bacterium]|nr:DUF3237 family protein [Chloroflexota bacterium]